MLRARFTRQNFSRHFHERYCLGVIEAGGLAFRYRGQNLLAPAGSVNLAVPGEVHDGHGADESGWAYRMFYLEPSVLGDAASQMADRTVAFPHFRPGVIEDPALAMGLQSLHKALEEGCPALEGQTRLLCLLTGWIRRHAEEPPAQGGSGRSYQEHRGVARVRELLEDRHAEDLGLEELAREARLSPYHLTRTFARQVGLPPHAYLTQVRVRRAANLLAGPEPIAQVAASVGFSDQSHLNRHFKRFKGVTPGRYRSAVRKIVQDG